jgi:hypothetical protein
VNQFQLWGLLDRPVQNADTKIYDCWANFWLRRLIKAPSVWAWSDGRWSHSAPVSVSKRRVQEQADWLASHQYLGLIKKRKCTEVSWSVGYSS